NGSLLTNAPLTFTVTQGGAKVATALNGTAVTSLQICTDTNAQASVWLLLPSTLNTTNLITATASSGTNTTAVTFTETTMRGLKLWLLADVGAQTNGSAGVTNWLDQSGSTNNAVQTTGSNCPLFVTNS